MDLNNLITTIITSTAALVAIIGGFLVSRVIAISSEQNGIKRKIREINNDKIAKQELIDNIEKYLFEDDLNDFVTKENIESMLDGISLEDIIEVSKFNYLTKEELEPYFIQLRGIADELYELLDKADKDYDTFSEFNKEFNYLKYPNRIEWYEMIFEVIYELSLPETSDALGYFRNLPTSSNFTVFTPNADYKVKQRECDRLIDDVRILELQKEEQIKILGDYGKPKWIWSGLFVLIYASIVSIIYPSTLLPYPQNTYNDIQSKILILCLFYSQLLALFFYLSIAMYKLTHSKEDN